MPVNIKFILSGRKILAETVCVILVFVLSLSLYLAVVGTREDPLEHPLFLQTNLFYPAIFFAAGRGIGTADISKIPGLEDFVYKRTLHFDTDNIPEDLEVVPLDTVLEVTHLYLFYCMGWLWRIFGVSAWVGALYAGLMRAVCACIVYGLFRLVLSRTVSVFSTVLIFSSPLMLDSAIELRDYGKAPFILGFLLAAAWLVRKRRSSACVLCVATVLGIFLGIGLGFRQDVLACLPPAIFTLLFVSKFVATRPWKVRLSSILVFVVFFIVAAFPILKGIALEGAQAPAHAFFHGISPESEARLDFGGASYDSLISVDPAAYGIVNAYTRRTGNFDSMVNKGSAEYRRAQGDLNAPLLRDPYIYFTGAEYGRYANQVIWEMCRLYPADIVARAWRSVFSIHTVPAQMCTDMRNCPKRAPGWLRILVAVHGVLASHLAGFGLIYTVIVLVAVSLRQFWLAVYMLACLAWFSGYPTLWYEIRHLFFLAVIPIWAALICVDRGIRILWACRNAEQCQNFMTQHFSERRWAKPVRNSVVFLILFMVMVLVPTLLFRLWQGYQVRCLAEKMSQATLEPIKVTSRNHDGRLYLYPVETLPGLMNSENLPAGETAWEYVALELDTEGKDIVVTIHYDETRVIYNFTQDICVRGAKDGKDGKVTLFFPIYEVDMNYGGQLMAEEILKAYPSASTILKDSRPISEQEWWKRGRFQGVSVSERDASSCKGFYRVQDTEELTLLPIFQLPEDPRFLRPYKTGPWERKLRQLPPLVPDYRKNKVMAKR